MAFATLEDVAILKPNMTETEREQAGALLETVSDRLRLEAFRRKKDLDQMANESAIYASVLASVTAGIVERTLNLVSKGTPIFSQYSESGFGYSMSGTVPNSGESLYIKKNELKALGLINQRMGAVSLD